MLNNINDLLLVAKSQESYEPYHETLEKITLTGAEYFDLGYKVSDFAIGDTIRFEGIVKGTDADTISSSGSQLMFSIGNDGGQWLGKAQNGTKYAFGTLNQSTISFNEEVLADVTITISGNANKPTFTITGSVTSDTETSTIPQRSATPVYYDFSLLFGAGTRSTGEKAYGGDYTIKCGKIYINGTMAKDYVPALDYLLRPCLYDKITKTFLYAKKLSDGTTTYDLVFKRWNKFDVDYIQSDGNQYIDTGITDYCSFKCVAQSNVSPTGNTVLFCGGNNARGGTFFGAMANGKWGAGTTTGFFTNVPATTKAEIDVKFTSTGCSGTVNGVSFNRNISNNTINKFSIFSSMLSQYSFIGKLFECEAYINDVLVRDFKPVVWHNADTTAEACLYDEVYNKMYPNLGTGSLKAYITNDINYNLMSYTYMNTHGYYISATGVVTAQAESDYTDAIAVEQGDIVTLTTSTTSRVSNKRIHGYNGTSTSDWVSQLGVIEYSQAGEDTRTLSVVVPSGVSYIRISHSIYGETQCDLTITRTYEVGTYIQTLKTSTAQTMGYMVDLGIEPKDGIGYHIKTSTNVNSSNYVFGARKATSIPSQQSNKPIIVGLTGSQTGGTILSSVMGASATWKSDNTNWTRPSSSTSSYVYECSLQTYKENNELKFNIIGYNYNLAKDADKQTLTYTDAIDNADETDISILCIGGLNANNILNGNNAYFFIECRQPNTDMTLLPVVNNNQFYLIDNKTKQTYQFYKIGSPTPTTDNIRLKKLDGTFIDGTL